MDTLNGKVVLLTGASMGIGEAIAHKLVGAGSHLILVSRSQEKLAVLSKRLTETWPSSKVIYRATDIANYDRVTDAIQSSIEEIGDIDILINNAGLALGAPAAFAELKVADVMTMNNTNINGLMWVTHGVLNKSFLPRESVYHANKACQEAFTNAIRNELSQTNIRVLALRPGCVATNFHAQRVGYDKAMYDSFFDGFDPLTSQNIADATVYMLRQPLGVSVKALDVVPSAQRSINVFDRTWNIRNSQ